MGGDSKLCRKFGIKSQVKINLIRLCVSFKNPFRDNIKTHTASKPLKCKRCSFQTNWTSNLERHIRVVLEKKPLEKKIACPLCLKKWVSQSGLNAHMWIHTGEKPYFCKFCKKGFTYPKNKNLHELKCKQRLCSTGTDEYWTEKQKLKCGFCDFETKSPSALGQHSRVHSKDKPQKCTMCTFSTNYVGNLNAHMMGHTGNKRYKCPHCDLHVAYKCHLRNHIAVQHNKHRTKDHSCNFCQKSFYSKRERNSHLATHTGEKAYTCYQCEYQTQYSSNLRRHKRSHDGVKPHQCPDCSYRSVSSDHLKRHRRICKANGD